MKKATVLLSLILAVVLLFTWYFRPIGKVFGAELDTIVIDGIEYIRCSPETGGHDDHSSLDIGIHLGIIPSGNEVLHIYAVKDDAERGHLYVRWEWEGVLYIRADRIVGHPQEGTMSFLS